MGRTDRASMTIQASRTEIYRALVDPEARRIWLPPAGMTGRMEHWDAHVGGGYRMVLTYDDPAGESTVVTITADDVPVGIDPADHDEGLRSSLAQLADFVRSARSR